MTAITEKALDTSMQYDTETAWKLFGKVLKKLAADLKGPWGCVKMPGGVSIFQFSRIFLNSNLILVSKIESFPFLISPVHHQCLQQTQRIAIVMIQVSKFRLQRCPDKFSMGQSQVCPIKPITKVHCKN